jgi:NADH-quinone oxidoreductase subunit C
MSKPARPMLAKAEALKAALIDVLGDLVHDGKLDLGDEVTVTVAASHWEQVALTLRDDPTLKFELMVDLCGMDYSAWKNEGWDGKRFAVVTHLLSVTHNWRLRVRAFCADDDAPVMPSVTSVWSSANWFEREAFDLFGIVFTGHDDLRRILTDYGFIGHPFRKDFPSHGNVEMRYDAEQKRVVYQPVTIELRENVPRIVREDQYGGH